MRILQAFDLYSLSYGGGTVDVVSKLSRALQQRGHEVTLCTSDYKLDCPTDIKTKAFHSWLNLPGIYVMPSLVSLNIKDYDVIHLHCYRSFQNAVLCQKAIKHSIPYIIDAHGSTVDLRGGKRVIRRFYDKIVGYKTLAHASKLIAETVIGVSEYKRLGVDESKIVVLHPMFNTKEFEELPLSGIFRAKYDLDGKAIILFMGRIHQAKGIAFLVKSVLQLLTLGYDINLVIVGQDDGYKNELTRLIKDVGIEDRVIFTGYLSGREKLSVLVDADVLVQPSKYEAGARPSLEAMLCGNPVIITNNTGAALEISKFDGGYSVDYGNVWELADKIKYVLENPELAKAKTSKAREYIKDSLSFDKQIGKYEQLYEEAIR